MKQIASFLFITAVLQLTAQDNTPKYSNEFLNIGIDARAFGLGLSMSSHVDDVSSLYWNPAGLNDMKADHQLEMMHAAYFAGIANYDFVGYARKLDDQSSVGISALRFSVDDIADTRFLFDATGAINYNNIQFFSASDYALFISYARVLPILGGLKTGGSVKVLHRMVGKFATSWGFGMDLSTQKTFGKWMVGLMAKDVFGTFNAWSHNTDEVSQVYTLTGNAIPENTLEITLPRLIAGVSRKVQLSNAFSVLATADFVWTFDGKRNTLVRTNFGSLDPMGGIEIGYKNLAFLRGGVNQFQQIEDFDGSQSWSFQPNAGIGIKFREVAIDYALTDIGDQSAGLYSNVFSIKVDFNAKEDDE
ncbi:MAG: hypothetical protein ACFHWX_22775 [Bacteroidota bacterium]